MDGDGDGEVEDVDGETEIAVYENKMVHFGMLYDAFEIMRMMTPMLRKSDGGLNS